MNIKLYLVRHGQTQENVANILQGHLPGHLTQEGIRQAQHLRDELRYTPFNALYCSDLKRCVDTANILNEPHNLNLITTTLLRERDWGPFTGMDILKARTRIDHQAESMENMLCRAQVFLEELSRTFAAPSCILVVSHGLFCRVLQAACLNKDIREIPRMDNAEVRCLTLTLPFSFSHPQEETGATAD